MAEKEITKVIKIRVCDLCGRKIYKRYEYGGKEFETKICMMYEQFPTKEDYANSRKVEGDQE